MSILPTLGVSYIQFILVFFLCDEDKPTFLKRLPQKLYKWTSEKLPNHL